MSQRSVLLVDDDLGGRLALAGVLEDAGYQVIEAESLAEARKQLKALPFALAVLDVELADGQGPELIAELVRAHPGIAVAILSGNDAATYPGAHVSLVKAMPTQELLNQLELAIVGVAR
jgi:DNA-binding NtrC family response regulator